MSLQPGPSSRRLLVVAAKNGHVSIVRLMLENDVRIENESEMAAITLHAATTGRDAVLKLLFEKHPLPLFGDLNKPLYSAAKSGHEATVELLLGAGADPDAKGILAHTRSAHLLETEIYPFHAFYWVQALIQMPKTKLVRHRCSLPQRM